MKKTMIAFILTVCTMQAFAQIEITIPEDTKGIKKENLDTSYLECKYNLTYLRDTTLSAEEVSSKELKKVQKEDLMILQIGKNYSKFYSYKTFRADSMMAMADPAQVIANMEMYKRGETYTVFRNIPQSRIIYTDKISRDSYKYEEAVPDFQWQILDDTCRILDYECRKAVCEFRGRRYEAWFTTQIPVNAGPWKFSGLPGLIVKVQDIRGHYIFELAGIREIAAPIAMEQQQYIKATLKKYLATLRKFTEDPIGYMVTYSNVKVRVVNNNTGKEMTPAEMVKAMRYDFMEIQ